jgi:hypothetical protein
MTRAGRGQCAHLGSAARLLPLAVIARCSDGRSGYSAGAG